MRVHHVNGLTMCPPCARLVDGHGGWLARGVMTCHCLLVETERDGLVLVDTAIGLDDLRSPSRRLGWPFRTFILPRRLAEEDALVTQVRRLGHDPADVRHVIVTHLDVDHAGGIPDFPRASVHVMKAEHDAALAPSTFAEHHRYRPAHWAHGPKWELYTPEGEPWRGFPAVRGLRGLPPEILLIPLPGHTRGHAAIAVETPDGPLLHCGDAYFHRHTLSDATKREVPGGLRGFEQRIAHDRAQVHDNHVRLRALAAGGDVRVFCAHDPEELRAAQQPG